MYQILSSQPARCTTMLTVACVWLAAFTEPTRAFDTNDKARVLYVGDSIAYETGATVAFLLNARGTATFYGATSAGMAICDFLPETRAPGGRGTFLTAETPPIPDLAELVRSQRPHAVIMQFWGNSWELNACMRGSDDRILEQGSANYYERYRRDSRRAMEVIRSTAASVGIAMPKVFWVLQGPDRALPDRTHKLNDIYLELARIWSTRFASIDAGFHVSMAAFYYQPGDRYDYAQFLPCYDWERTNGTCIDAYGGVAQIHRDGDDIHFCLGNPVRTGDWFGNCDAPSPGITRYGIAIAGQVIDTLRL